MDHARRRRFSHKPRHQARLYFDTPEALEAHRELELLRALGSPQHRGRAAYIRDRARKLDRCHEDFRHHDGDRS
jgi:hypothetical protein